MKQSKSSSRDSRADLSAYLVHLTRDTKFAAEKNLLSILDDTVIKARTSFGMAKRFAALLDGSEATQRSVSLTETPLDYLRMMTDDIPGRHQKFRPYGLVFNKSDARRAGCNPVWYVDITPGHTWLTGPVEDLVKAAVNSSGGERSIDRKLLQEQSVFRLTPFIEQMGSPAGIRKEFAWEREWRHVDDLPFTVRDVVAVVVPEAEHARWAKDIRELSRQWERRAVPLIDPHWSRKKLLRTLQADADR